MKKFKCKKCGLCCKNLDVSEIYKELHNGDGICNYLDLNTNKCNIYDNRPELCNIEISYNLYFSETFSIQEYYDLNYKGCWNLWEKKKMKK